MPSPKRWHLIVLLLPTWEYVCCSKSISHSSCVTEVARWCASRRLCKWMPSKLKSFGLSQRPVLPNSMWFSQFLSFATWVSSTPIWPWNSTLTCATTSYTATKKHPSPRCTRSCNSGSTGTRHISTGLLQFSFSISRTVDSRTTSTCSECRRQDDFQPR